MISWVLCMIVTALYGFMCFRSARVEYRRSYVELAQIQVPAVYGHGWMTPADKRAKALNDAYTMFAFWPVVLPMRATEHLITSCGQADPYVIDMIEHEMDGESVAHTIKPKPPPSETCPCGYVTECPVHCGDGSCHTEDPWLRYDGPEIIRISNPDQIRVIKKSGYSVTYER